MDAKEYCIANLGKEITVKDEGFRDDSPIKKAMVVGYNMVPTSSGEILCLLVSFTDNSGWSASEEYLEKMCDDKLLLHSPLNQTYWHIGLDEIVEEE